MCLTVVPSTGYLSTGFILEKHVKSFDIGKSCQRRIWVPSTNQPISPSCHWHYQASWCSPAARRVSRRWRSAPPPCAPPRFFLKHESTRKNFTAYNLLICGKCSTYGVKIRRMELILARNVGGIFSHRVLGMAVHH